MNVVIEWAMVIGVVFLMLVILAVVVGTFICVGRDGGYPDLEDVEEG